MTTTTPRDRLVGALEAVDRAVEACLALAWEPAGALAAEARQRAAAVAVAEYEAADTLADLLLAAIVGAGGCPGLLDAAEAACARASERTVACSALWAGGAEGRAAERALAVCRHAEGRAAARHLAVMRGVVLPWATRRAERMRGAA